MKNNLRRFIVFNRLPIAVVLLGLGVWIGFEASWWAAVPLFLIAILMATAHFLIGPMTLIQGYIENGDMEGAQALLNKVKYPNLLYKPVRSSYYMLRANLSTMTDDLDKAEADLKKSLETGITEKEFEGTAYLQLGSIAYRKGNMKEANENLRKALKAGLPDKDNEATAYLQLSSICLQRRDFRNAKLYFGKAKSCKPKNAQVVEQINEMGKYMARIPG
ncbi:MAG: tetratricopeptide repeat protein [Sphingobacteriales bacterium]|nr:MAG: tetratricopeptide repeat protein [Sphingobacteriales bacterium]